MANSFARDSHIPRGSVMGNARVVMGVLSMTDGPAASSVASGLEHIWGGTVTGKSAHSGGVTLTCNANVPGDFKVLSSTSGDTFQVVLWGD